MISKSLTQSGQSRRKFISGQSRRKCIIIGFLLVTLVVISLAVAAAVTVAIHGSRDDSRDSDSQPSVAYQLHVNPADSVILTAETPDGDLIWEGILSGKGGIAETAELAETVEIAKLGKK